MNRKAILGGEREAKGEKSWKTWRGLLSLENRRFKGMSSKSVNIWRMSTKTTEPDSSVEPSNRTRSNGHKLKHRRLCPNMRKHFSTVRKTKQWFRFPGEYFWFFILGDIKKLSWKITLNDPIWAAVLKKTSRDPFQPQPFCSSVIHVITEHNGGSTPNSCVLQRSHHYFY